MIDEVVSLGIQTNVGNTFENAIWKARKWATGKAKSFSFVLTHTDYHGHVQDHETGYASIKVTYYTKVKEGQYPVEPVEEDKAE